MREGFRGPIIAVDAGGERGFSSELEMTELPPIWKIRSLVRHMRPSANIMQILLRAGMLNSAATSIAQRELADVLLRRRSRASISSTGVRSIGRSRPATAARRKRSRLEVRSCSRGNTRWLSSRVEHR